MLKRIKYKNVYNLMKWSMQGNIAADFVVKNLSIFKWIAQVFYSEGRVEATIKYNGAWAI